ncbi:MAG: caspase family protein [Myxococcales bacterium]|nr:caspase family protein [Myxococcales bacterium]
MSLGAAAQPAADRVAVLVGSNSAIPGARRLRYAHSDVDSVAAALREVGGFSDDAVHVLRDPRPERVLELLQDVPVTPDTTLLFYYSGHAEADALYPGGRPLTVSSLRQAMDATGARLQLGIVDACRGGTWTGTKGLVPEAVPFELPDPLDSEGAAWIASTSGVESAHEAELVHGSLFTHHLVVGMRGAADHSAEGEVTLSEAFDYAKRRTARDAAVFADTKQTPSFHLQLRGQRDVVLSKLQTAPTTLTVTQTDGPLQVLHVESGVVLLELPPGQQEVRLALPPGGYVIRRSTDQGVLSTSIELAAGESVSVAESGLQLRAVDELAPKGRSLRIASTHDILPARHGDVRGRLWVLGLGSAWRLDGSVAYSVNRSVQVATPAVVTVRQPGPKDRAAWMPWGGVDSVGIHRDFRYTRWTLGLRVGMDHRARIGEHARLLIGLSAALPYYAESGQNPVGPNLPPFGRFSMEAQLVWSKTWADRLTLNVGVVVGPWAPSSGAFVTLSPGRRGGRRTPLLQWHAFDHVSFDAYINVIPFGIGSDGRPYLNLAQRPSPEGDLLLGITATL